MLQVSSKRYEALEVVSSGGFGTVYKARDRSLPRFVALKVLHAHLKHNDATMRRFEKEADALTQLRSPYTCVIYDFGTLDDEEQSPFLAMEFVDGIALDRVLAKGAMSLESAIPLMDQMCQGLEAAHALGIIHRDIKPPNIMLVGPAGAQEVKVVDFGLAKVDTVDASLTKTGETMGTPHYMSPEQCHGHKLDARADVYSLGCVFYEMLTGEKLFSGDSHFDVMAKQINSPPQFPPGSTVPPWARNMILRMVAKEPAERFASLAEVRAVLANPKLSKPVRSLRFRWKGIHGAIAACVVLAVLGGGAALWGLNSMRKAENIRSSDLAELHRTQVENKFRDHGAVGQYEPVVPAAFDDDAIKALIAGGTKWKLLRLPDTKITDRGMQELPKLDDSLKALVIANTAVTDKGMMYAPPELRMIGAIDTKTFWDPAVIQRLREPVELRLTNTLLNDAGMAELGRKPSLVMLVAAGTQITDAGVEKLVGLPRLQFLQISETAVTDRSVPAMLRLPLKLVTLRKCGLTDAGVAELARHPTLEELFVSGDHVTTAGLMRLAASPRLARLAVDGRKVDVAALRATMPRVTVVDESQTQ